MNDLAEATWRWTEKKNEGSLEAGFKVGLEAGLEAGFQGSKIYLA